MRIFTTFAFGAALLIPAASQGAVLSPFRMHAKGAATVRTAEVRDFRKTPVKDGVWRPKIEKYYGWQRGKWTLEDTYTKTYDFAGNAVEEVDETAEGETIITQNAYDAHNKLISRLVRVSTDGVNFENSVRSEFEYDPVLYNLITLRKEWMWMKGDWQLVGNNYKRRVVRDDNGNVTLVEISTLFDGYYDPIERLEITYGDDGKANRISVSNLGYDGSKYFWVDSMTVEDIEWENTDGQIADAENLFTGANRVKKATFIGYEDDIEMKVNVEYADGNESYRAVVSVNQDGFSFGGLTVYEPLENEGYRSVSTTYYGDEVMSVDEEEVNYDSWGNLTKSYAACEEDGYTEIYEDTKGVVEYDADGFPVTYEVSMTDHSDEGDPVIEYVFRAEFSEYSDVSLAVEEIGSAASDAPVEYFNMQGVKISDPVPGTLCIRRQGASSKKIIF